MQSKLTIEQQKGNMLREYDGFVKLAAIDPDLCIDVATSKLGQRNGGDFNELRKQAETAVATIQLMGQGGFNFTAAAKAAQQYFAPECIVAVYFDGDD
ncbi:hypothetical protein [Duganella sp. HH105]|uniref:hypothetical protein n=1 Tax=Duganella sp. HH105 TaxID=1781067 RepID=UPI000893451A|nr:hypothetical protein [Duganella sp. HH105]OEZ59880.1 hypothetical protein DUGA6_35190 [Duganella sp. HH105]